MHGRDKYHHEKQFCAVISKTEHPSGGSPTVLLNYRCTEGNKGSKSAEGDRAAQTIPENTTWLMTLDGHIIQGNQTKEQWYMMLTRERDTLYLVCNHSWADGKPFFMNDEHPYTYRRMDITDEGFKDNNDMSSTPATALESKNEEGRNRKH